jgi:hypothetical protein
MKYIGFNREDEAIEWAKNVIGIDGPVGLCRAMSAVDATGAFVLVVVLSNFTPRNIDMHTAAIPGAQWASPREAIRMFNSIFGYAFLILNAIRVTGLVRRQNYAARQFDEHIGFCWEGCMREAFDDDDLLIYGFLKREYLTHPWYRTNHD